MLMFLQDVGDYDFPQTSFLQYLQIAYDFLGKIVEYV